MNYVTWNELLQFCAVQIAFATFLYAVLNNKRK